MLQGGKREASAVNQVLNLVIESAEISRGWAQHGSEQAAGGRARLRSGAFWLPTAASGGVRGQIPPSSAVAGFDRSIRTHPFKQMADAPCAPGSGISIRVQLPGSRTLHRHRALITSPATDEQGAGKRIKKVFLGGQSAVVPLHGNSTNTRVSAHGRTRPARGHGRGSAAQRGAG